MESRTHDRLTDAATRLRAALQGSNVPAWLTQAAHGCLIDIDCALSSGVTPAQVTRLLAQVDAILSVIEPRGSASGNHGSNTP